MSAGTDSKILKRLEDWPGNEPLPEVLELYRALLDIQSRVSCGIHRHGPALPEGAGSDGTNCRLPLLRYDDLFIDLTLLAKTFGEVVSLLGRYPGLFGQSPDTLRKFSDAPDFLKDSARAFFDGDPLPDVPGNGSSQPVLEFAIQATMRPFLIGHAEALSGSVDQENWRRGYCPVCGGSPDFAFLDKEHGARWLLCGRCDAEWIFQRLECPYCGNQKHQELAYFTDEQGLYRLYTCDACRRYLKAIDLRRSQSEVLLPLERYLTLHLDMQARKNGYG